MWLGMYVPPPHLSNSHFLKNNIKGPSLLFLYQICVVDKRGTAGWGSSARFELSHKIVAMLQDGPRELADVIDELTGKQDVRSAEGAMGVITNGHLKVRNPFSLSLSLLSLDLTSRHTKQYIPSLCPLLSLKAYMAGPHILFSSLLSLLF